MVTNKVVLYLFFHFTGKMGCQISSPALIFSAVIKTEEKSDQFL
jgi:hypothetical protein